MTYQTLRRRRNWSPKVTEIERTGLLAEWSDRQIYKELLKELPADEVPSLKTVQRHMEAMRPDDGSGPWSVSDAANDEPRVVLKYLCEEVESSLQWGTVTKKQAAWMVKLDGAAPGLGSFLLHALAREYINRSKWEILTNDLDAWLAFRPWESDDRRQRYEDALNEESIPRGLTVRGAPFAVGANWFHSIITTKLEDVVGVPGAIRTIRAGDGDAT